MTSEALRIDVPICHCVNEARELSAVFPIPSKYRTEGHATGAGTGAIFGSFVIRCDYCAKVLKWVEAHDFVRPIELHESSESGGTKE